MTLNFEYKLCLFSFASAYLFTALSHYTNCGAHSESDNTLSFKSVLGTLWNDPVFCEATLCMLLLLIPASAPESCLALTECHGHLQKHKTTDEGQQSITLQCWKKKIHGPLQ